MGMIETLSRREAIGLLLASFPASATDGAIVALAYLAATEDCSDFAVRFAVESYVKGEILGQDRRFAPSAALFADTARRYEISSSTVDFVARNPAALERGAFPEAYRQEMQRRVRELLRGITSAMSENLQKGGDASRRAIGSQPPVLP